jgi:hypothetical protein
MRTGRTQDRGIHHEVERPFIVMNGGSPRWIAPRLCGTLAAMRNLFTVCAVLSAAACVVHPGPRPAAVYYAPARPAPVRVIETRPPPPVVVREERLENRIEEKELKRENKAEEKALKHENKAEEKALKRENKAEEKALKHQLKGH